jgi:uncharacterized protein YbcV (DUF1398 family)
MDTEVMHRVLEESEAGRMIFPDVVKALIGAGVESYHADLIRGENTYYMPNGETDVVKAILPRETIAEEFSATGLVAAIRGAQADKVRYPEFVKLATSAGTVAYRVFLTGKRVVYFGRKGEIHVEEFPGAKSQQ